MPPRPGPETHTAKFAACTRRRAGTARRPSRQRLPRGTSPRVLRQKHGPAMIASFRPPMVASVPGKRMTVESSLTSRLTSLYGLVTRMTSCTPGISARAAVLDHALVAGDSDRGALRAGHGMRLETQRLYALAYGLHLGRRGVRFHDNEHGSSVNARSSNPRKWRGP